MVLRTDSTGEPFVLVGDWYCIRVLRGRLIGGEGDDRVDTLGGPEILNLVGVALRFDRQSVRVEKDAALAPEFRSLTQLNQLFELQSLDSTRVLVEIRQYDFLKTFRNLTLDTRNLKQPELLPVVSNMKPDLRDLGPFLHMLSIKQDADVRMLAPNL